MAAPTKRFNMDTRTFSDIWNNHLKKAEANDWRKFVLALFKRFTTGNEYKNMETMSDHDKTWKKWDEDKQYTFLSEKCYSKCMSIRKTILKAEGNTSGFQPDLPNGYKERNGKGAGTRATGKELFNIFTGA